MIGNNIGIRDFALKNSSNNKLVQSLLYNLWGQMVAFSFVSLQNEISISLEYILAMCLKDSLLDNVRIGLFMEQEVACDPGLKAYLRTFPKINHRQ